MKHVVLGVTGGIAAYKAAEIASRLVKQKMTVHVIMTAHATEFIKPLTFQALTNQPVVVDMFGEPTTWDVEHISLAQKADLFLIAPATANIIGKMAHGIADDFLSTTVLATKAPVLIAPAMNTNMYQHPAVQDNILLLKKRGCVFIPPASGRLACGDVGVGKLADHDIIEDAVRQSINRSQELKGKTVVVTAGGTRENIDPVRFIANRSSGKMGYAIAKEAYRKGAEVILISGITHLPCPFGVQRICVKETAEMFEEVMKYQSADAIIMAAAPSDFRVKNYSSNKIKKEAGDLTLSLIKNVDILKCLGEQKRPNQILIGFAAETDDLLKNAKKKLEEKNVDYIVANDITLPQSGFDAENNTVSMISKDGEVVDYPSLHKEIVAEIIVQKLYV